MWLLLTHPSQKNAKVTQSGMWCTFKGTGSRSDTGYWKKILQSHICTYTHTTHTHNTHTIVTASPTTVISGRLKSSHREGNTNRLVYINISAHLKCLRAAMAAKPAASITLPLWSNMCTSTLIDHTYMCHHGIKSPISMPPFTSTFSRAIMQSDSVSTARESL